MKIAVCGDSFAADWQVKYPDQKGWPNLLAEQHTVTNIAQAAVSEYKVLQQIKSIDFTQYNAVIISHASPNRVHCKVHPVHANDPLHKDADLIYSDLKDRPESDTKIAVDYFERYFELDYYNDISRLLCEEILYILGEYPELNQFHMVNNANGIRYDIPCVYNINQTFSKHPGLINHLDDHGNQIVFDEISHWLTSLN